MDRRKIRMSNLRLCRNKHGVIRRPNKIIKALLAVFLFSPITAVNAQELLKDEAPVFKISEIKDSKTDPRYHTINPDSIKITRDEVTQEKDFS